MITIKTAEDFAKMAVAGKVVRETLDAVQEAARPGVSMKELDGIGEKVIRDHDCVPSFLGYLGFPASICASPNEVIVHGIPGDYRLRDGDILSIDAGAIYEGWHGDAARTIPIGSVTEEVARLLRVTEEALWAGIERTQAGAKLGDIGHAISQIGEREGYGVVREYIGHGIGREMHEKPNVPNYGVPGKGFKLKTGMAICIEPMFNLGGAGTEVLDDDWTVVTADRSLSAHFEHTIGLTEDGPVVFTA